MNDDLAGRVAALELHREYHERSAATMAEEMQKMNQRLADIEKKVWLATGAIMVVQVFVVPIAQSIFSK